MKTYKIIKTNGSNHKNGLVNLSLNEAKEILSILELDYEKRPVRFKIVEEKSCN